MNKNRYQAAALATGVFLTSVGLSHAGVPRGDIDNDADVDLVDAAVFSACVSGPGGGLIGPLCLAADMDADGDVDLLDAKLFQSRFGFGQGPPRIDRFDPSPGTTITNDVGLREVRIGFSEPVSVPPDAVTAWALDGGVGPGLATSYDSATDVLTVSFPTPVQDDRLTIVIDYSIADVAGNELDGEMGDPASAVLPSGDGVRGGQAVFRINILQGDANGDGIVDPADQAIVQGSFGLCAGEPGFNPLADLNGNGCVGAFDLTIVQDALGRTLPPTDGVAPNIASRIPDINARVRGSSLSLVSLQFTEPIRDDVVTARYLFATLPDGSLQPAATISFFTDANEALFEFSPPLAATADYRLNFSNALADTSGELLAGDAVKQWTVSVDATPTTIASTSPAGGEGLVALTREMIITFRDSVQPGQTLTSDDIRAEFGGQVLTLLEDTALNRAPRIMPDGKRVKLFYDPPLPPAARIRVTINGNNILDDLGNLLDADGDGLPGGVTTIDFDTCSTSRIPNTSVFGFVFASAQTGPNGENIPLEGATISVEGILGLEATTDATGFFSLGADLTNQTACNNDPAAPAGPGIPAPDFIVHVNGKTVTAVGGIPIPTGGFYPTITKTFHSSPGHCVQIMQDHKPFDIFLPFVADDVNDPTLVPVAPNAMTEIALSDAGKTRFCELFPDECAANPNAADALKLMIPPGSFNNDNGSPGNMAGIFPVDSTRLPAPLPGGQVHTMDITIQSDGATNFDLPTPICFPNVRDPDGNRLRPGEKTGLVSFNHDTGKWELRGPMTATEDADGDGFAEMVCADHGVGVASPGWHGTAAGGSGSGGGGGSCGGGSVASVSAARVSRACVASGAACAASLGAGGLLIFFPPTSIPVLGVFATGVVNGLAIGGACITASCECTGRLCDPPPMPRECSPPRSSPLAASTGVAAPEFDEPIDELLSLHRAVSPIIQQITAIYRSGLLTGSLTQEQEVELDALRAQLNALAGGDFVSTVRALRVRLASQIIPTFADVPPAGRVHFSVQTERGVILRSRTSSNGRYQVALGPSPDGALLTFFDPVSWTVGFTQMLSIVPGTRFTLHDYLLNTDITNAEDTDIDGLPDIAEVVIGTDFSNTDTDGDGVLDGAEIRAGTDPLDGLPAATGVIAATDTQGNAIDICAINNIGVVADSESGITVFDVTAGQAPVAIAQVATPGTALAVSCTGDLIPVAVADQGLVVIDVSDPPAARIARQVAPFRLGGGSAQAVASAGGLALVGTTSGSLALVELDTGVVLDQVQTMQSAIVQDIAIAGETAHVYTNRAMETYSFLSGTLTRTGLAHTLGGRVVRGRIFVGGGIAYLVYSTGYKTFDVSNPSSPFLIADAANTGQAIWKQIVTTGSGIGVAAVGRGPFSPALDNISLYNTTDPSVTDLDGVFVISFPTPGIARAVTIFNGQAYIADGLAGLQVINYQAFDTGSIAPTGTLSVVSDGIPLLDGGSIVEGTRIVVAADVADDAQIRNVEFMADGQRIVVDGCFPFETVFRVPLGQAGRPITFTAIARDTGGNKFSPPSISLSIVPDTVPPTVQIEEPEPDATFFVHDGIGVRVNATDNVEVADISFRYEFGPPAHVTRVSFDRWNIDAPTTLGPHELVVTATDLAGLSTDSLPLSFVVKQRVNSREFTVLNDLVNPVPIRDVVSREFTVLNDLVNPIPIRDVVSREFTVAVGPEPPP